MWRYIFNTPSDIWASVSLARLHEMIENWPYSYNQKLPFAIVMSIASSTTATATPMNTIISNLSIKLAMYITGHHQNQLSWFLEWVKRDKYREKSQNQQNSRFHRFFYYENYATSFNCIQFNFTRIYMEFVLINDKSLQ